MTKTRIALTCVALVAALGVIYAVSAPNSAAEETTVLHLLVVENGEFTEVSSEVTLSELETIFDGAVVASLLHGNNVLLNSPDEIEAASLFTEVEGADEIVARFGTLAVTWGCVKCCYSDHDCCCQPDDPPPDPKDPDGD